MRRLNQTVKGLVLDIDSFEELDILLIESMTIHFSVICFTSNKTLGEKLKSNWPTLRLIYIENFSKSFLPSPSFLSKVLSKLELKQTEIAYVSSEFNFIKNALQYLSVTILIDKIVTSEIMGNAPDYIFYSLNEFHDQINRSLLGYGGEVILNPTTKKNKARMIRFNLFDENEAIPVITFGRYFNYSHYMNQIHPFSSAIFLNKKDGNKSYGIYNECFAKLLSNAVKWILNNHNVEFICSVPARQNQIDRFTEIVQYSADLYGLKNINSNFKVVKEYGSQKKLDSVERIENVKDVFLCERNLEDKNVILIDDIITTGATIKESVRTLKKSGAKEVYVICLGVNQFAKSYWSSNSPFPICDKCGSDVSLFINSKNKTFFYSCRNRECNHTMDFDTKFQEVQRKVDSEDLIL